MTELRGLGREEGKRHKVLGCVELVETESDAVRAGCIQERSICKDSIQ